MKQANIGVIGVAPMGSNLALNIESRGYTVAVWNRTGSKTKRFVQKNAGKNLIAIMITKILLASPLKYGLEWLRKRFNRAMIKCRK